MKKITLTFFAFTATIILIAQSPQAFKYQAVARNSSGEILVNKDVAFQISILQGSTTGSSVYVETHDTITSELGLVNLEIGSGNIVSGDFTSVEWGGDTYFMQVEMDTGTGLELMGTTQLLAVPYSLYAQSSGDAGANEIDELVDGRTQGSNVFLGSFVGINDDSTNNRNVAVGKRAFQANISGEFNTAIGYRTLYSNTIGNNNTALGYHSNYYNVEGSNNTIIGYEAGKATSLHNKSGNVFLGYQAGYNDTTDNKLYIENSDSTYPLIYGEFDKDILAVNGSLGIGTQSPDSTALLDMESTSKGFLLPRMSGAQISNILNPANGLQIYNTDNDRLYIFVNSEGSWKEVSYGSSTLPTTPEYEIGTGGSCTNTIINGTYEINISLTSSEFVLIEVNVLSVGYYTISTDTINGYSFYKEGTFTSTGVQTLNLFGSGIPLSDQTDIFTATASSEGGSCTFSVVVTVITCLSPLIDTRDGQEYTTVLIGNQCWMAENLNFEIPDYSFCYNDIPDSCDVYGRFYVWLGALEVCPTGWHLPSDSEWCTLTQYIDPTVDCDEEISGIDCGIKMKSTTGWSFNGNGTNDFLFNALPAGYYVDGPGSTGIGNSARFWTSTETVLTSAMSRVLSATLDGIKRDDYDYHIDRFSVRCIKD